MTHLLHLDFQVVDCGLLNFGLLLFKGCAKLPDIDMSDEYTGQAKLGFFQLPEIVYRSLQHGAMHYHAIT